MQEEEICFKDYPFGKNWLLSPEVCLTPPLRLIPTWRGGIPVENIQKYSFAFEGKKVLIGEG